MSQPASFVRAVASQAAMEARLTSRRSENLLAMIGIPAAVLLFFGTIGRGGEAAPLDRLLPSILSVALVASGLVNLGIATAYEREYGVLKRLGGAPLGRVGLLAAKLGVVGAIGAVQIVGLLGLAVVLGWRPGSISLPALVLSTAIGIATFAAIGLLLAGTLRAEATLVLANALFLAAILLGGVLAPQTDLPGPLGAIAAVLASGALRAAFTCALSRTGDLVGPLVLVGAWGIGAFVAAARTFRWE